MSDWLGVLCNVLMSPEWSNAGLTIPGRRDDGHLYVFAVHLTVCFYLALRGGGGWGARVVILMCHTGWVGGFLIFPSIIDKFIVLYYITCVLL